MVLAWTGAPAALSDRASTGSMSRWTHWTARSTRFSPVVIASPTSLLACALRRTRDSPIKINTVLLRGVNEGQAVPLLKWSIRHGYELRFIEQMPLGPPHTWD